MKSAIAAGLLSLPAVFGAALHTSIKAVPAGWSLVGTPDASDTMTLKINLAWQNVDAMISKLYDVSTPSSAHYGKYLDNDAVNDLVAPSADAAPAVVSWLQSAGVTAIQTDGSWVTFATDVATANSLLKTTFAYYENEGTTKLRTTSYTLPEDVAAHINLITPTLYFGKTTPNLAVPPKTPQPPAKRSAPWGTPTVESNLQAKRAVTVDASCATLITPTCLKQLYNIGNYTPAANSSSRIAFGSFLGQSALYSDLVLYERNFGIPSQNFSVTLINGGINDQNASDGNYGEANLDVQNIIGIAHPLQVSEYITGGSPPFLPDLVSPVDDTNEPYLEYYQYLLSQPNSALPQVISNSYGDDENTVPYDYAVTVCNMIAMMGVRGITVLESSGDTGVGAPCKSNDGKNTTQFTPTFPGTCPYLLSVGGTQAVTPEIAWLDGSGGFSNYFTRPSYQLTQVNNYLTNYISPATLAYYKPFTNVSMRGFPDVSAHSLTPYFSVYNNGRLSRSGGTSASSPVWAGVIGLLNDARFQKGLPALGFMNPWLYSTGYHYLNDITLGNSRGCDGINHQSGTPIAGGGIIPYASWNATVGWDPVTGLGTPDFVKLRAGVLLQGSSLGGPINP